MKQRSYSWPQGHWDWYRNLAFKHGVRVGRMIFVGGQVDKDSAGAPLNVGNLAAQTAVVVRHIATVLDEFGASLADVTRLTAFYATDGDVDEAAFVADVARHFVALGGAPDGVGPTLIPVPLPWLALPGMRVEIEAVAMFGEGGESLPRSGVSPSALPSLPAPFQHGLRVANHVFVGAQMSHDAVDDARSNVKTVLSALSAGEHDLVRVGVWTQSTHVSPAVDASLASLDAARVVLPSPRLPASVRLRMDGWAMCDANGSPLARTASADGVRCDDMVFLSAQRPLDDRGCALHVGDLPAQTTLCMDRTETALARFGLGLDHMVKQTSFYFGAANANDIVSNQRLRSSRYREPAGASTGVPLQAFGVSDALVSIDTIAMT